MTPKINWSLTPINLGEVDYLQTYEAMQKFTAERTPETSDQLWLCEHPAVYTQGLAGRAEHIFNPGTIPVVQTNRGGQVTYHGPGQVVAYPLMDLKRAGYFIKEYVYRIEEAVIRTLLHFGVTGHRVAGAPGIYVRLDDPAGHAVLEQRPVKKDVIPDQAVVIPGLTRDPVPREHWIAGRACPGLRSGVRNDKPTGAAINAPHFEGLGKIAALGIKVSRNCTYHGLALNVAMELEPYSRINPCGYAGLQTVDLSTIGVHVGWAEAADILGQRLASQLEP
ncbi:MAG: lipoyl(octanoyl) transferase LipB [Comamonadaceae bacterium]|nr:MAG: lipoyl(octanoyl) transferase LipB [Comamonadaceae bacterium]